MIKIIKIINNNSLIMLRLVKIVYKNSRIYDLITIGPYAKKVVRNIAINSPIPIQMLSIWTQNTIIEPSLVPISQPTVKIQLNNSKFCHQEIGVAVKQINPSLSQITLQNGNKYKYRQLVYSGEPNQWKEDPINTSQNKTPRNVYNDYNYQNIQDLFKIKYGSVVFTIPKGPHFGYQNYFMVLLKSRMENNRKKQGAQCLSQNIQITVLCEGQKIFPFNQQLNKLMQKLLQQNKIKLLKGVSYKIDYDKKIITANSDIPIKYDHLFQYLPLKNPNLLQKSKINAFQNKKQTLNNQKYPNIYVMGNVYNKIYSLYSINEMSNIIAKNIIYRHNGVRKSTIYDDKQSIITIWVSDRECYRINVGNDKQKIKKNDSKYKIMRYWHGFTHKLLTKQEVKTLVNSQYVHNSKIKVQNTSKQLKTPQK